MRGALFSQERRGMGGGKSGRGMFSERSIFRSEDVLYSDFLPDRLPHREGQAHFLADCLRPMTAGKSPENVFIWGPPGVGKTSVSRFVLREMKEHTEVQTVYVNCWQNDTRHAVLTAIAYALGSFAPRRGTATDEIFEKACEGMKRRGGKGVVIVLDEVDKLLGSPDGGRLLYDLARGPAFSGKTGIVMISNDEYILRKIDERTRSSLSYQEVSYPPYSFEELKDIFSERISSAFSEGATKAGVNSAVARLVADSGGDVRLGLDCLLKAGRLAEDEGKQVSVEHVQKTIGKIQNSKTKAIISGLDKNLLPIAKILSDGKERMTGDLFSEYCKMKGETNERTFRNYLSELERKGVIDAKASGKGIRGKTRLIKLRNAEMAGRIMKSIDSGGENAQERRRG